MSSSPMTRTQYFNVATGTVRTGSTAHGESLTDVESGLLPLARWTESSLHSWGIADGLTVTATTGQPGVTVSPGAALDPLGRIVALAPGGVAVVDPAADPSQVVNIATVPVGATGVTVATDGLGPATLLLTALFREVLNSGLTLREFLLSDWSMMNPMLAQWGQITPNTHVPDPVNHRIQYASLQSDVVGNIVRALWVLQVAVGFVLLIACANMANLLLARAESRHREFAIRTALGAGRGRLLRQFMAEGVTLAVLGGAAGLALAYGGLKALIAANPNSLPRSADIGLDGSVVLFTVLTALLTGVVFGLAPLLHVGQRAVSLALKEGGTRTTATITRNRVRRGLVVTEVALAVMLVVGAGLMLKSFWKLAKVMSMLSPTGRPPGINSGVVAGG